MTDIDDAMIALAASTQLDCDDLNLLKDAMARERRVWRERLERAVLNAPGRGRVVLLLDFFALHELYTQLVDPEGEEGCCAGCARLPPSWCVNCDMQRMGKHVNSRKEKA